ncbi:transcription initiation factor IIB family protein [Halobacteria archaeon AArc-curdl1]|uniref:Transcription initiation factor IIB family protein n=1 Tax=Natronosalvus hydrolyticus TaxID=2979988 RepID=A0AAP3E6M2_9EURY|nr:transcription initiation factor IIB family protein [Halobacteria archaeon AArc-curdl1]
MTEKTCPLCSGKLMEIVSGSDTLVCDDCGMVDPETKTDQSDGGDKGDGSYSSSQTEDQSLKTEWIRDVEIKDSSDENLVELLILVDEVALELGFDDEERVRAAELATSAWENRLPHGRSMDTIVGACAYITSRENERPRPVSIIAEVLGEDEESVNKSYRVLITSLEVEVPLTGPDTYAYYLGEQLGIPNDVTRSVEDVLSKDIEISGNPAGIAAGALYLAANARDHDITLVEAGQAAGVAKETVWRKVSDLRESEVGEGCLTQV